MADLLLTLLAKDEMSHVFGHAAHAVEFLKENLEEMVKEAMEAEKVSAQLHAVVGELTEAYEAQAKQLSAKFAVDDDHIVKVQTILARYGEAPEVIGKTTEALLNFAAATGRDATQAADLLTRAVESGTGKIRGIAGEFEVTGDKAKDLAAATEMLAGKFAGAGDAYADTMAGRTAKAENAVQNLKEAFGHIFILLEAKTGVLDRTADAMRGLEQSMSQGHVMEYLNTLRGGAADLLSSTGLVPGASLVSSGIDLLGGAPDQTFEQYRAWQNAVEGNKADELKKGAEGVDSSKERKKKGAGTGAADLKAAFGQFDDYSPEKAYKQEEKEQEEFNKTMERLQADAVRVLEKSEKDLARSKAAAAKANEDYNASVEKADERHQDALAKINQREADRRVHDLMKQEAMMAQAGDRMGAALVNAFADQLGQLAAGGEFDVAGFFGGLITAIGGIVGAIMPGLGGVLIGAGAALLGGIVKGAGHKRHHDGAWVESFHGGGWPAMGGDEQPAVLQTGERVLSRREVARMGGQQGVDRAAGGGQGLTVNVQAVDGESVRQLFEGRGGRAILNAVRLGRGPLGALIKGTT